MFKMIFSLISIALIYGCSLPKEKPFSLIGIWNPNNDSQAIRIEFKKGLKNINRKDSTYIFSYEVYTMHGHVCSDINYELARFNYDSTNLDDKIFRIKVRNGDYSILENEIDSFYVKLEIKPRQKCIVWTLLDNNTNRCLPDSGEIISFKKFNNN